MLSSVLELLSRRNDNLLRMLPRNDSTDFVWKSGPNVGRQQAMTPRDISSMHQKSIVVISTDVVNETSIHAINTLTILVQCWVKPDRLSPVDPNKPDERGSDSSTKWLA